ncbi:hypothetical protein G6676_03015 [Polynucleobacter paneuropaeus]|jgi:hypothetical protein|nr:hypothetical protein [Polynucleobacter paneuropaeus]QWD34245.1 hypothetical protein G6676_03015 [Polynucleobacter paneuropaeus]
MKKYLLLSVFFLLACSKSSQTTFSLNCEGTYTEISGSGSVIHTTKQKRHYEIDANQMSERSCIKDGLVLNCYREIEHPNLQRTKEQFLYNTSDYSLSDGVTRIGVDAVTGKPIFIKTELFRTTCPMTVKRSQNAS